MIIRNDDNNNNNNNNNNNKKEETKCKLKGGNPCHYSVQTLFFFSTSLRIWKLKYMKQ